MAYLIKQSAGHAAFQLGTKLYGINKFRKILAAARKNSIQNSKVPFSNEFLFDKKIGPVISNSYFETPITQRLKDYKLAKWQAEDILRNPGKQAKKPAKGSQQVSDKQIRKQTAEQLKPKMRPFKYPESSPAQYEQYLNGYMARNKVMSGRLPRIHKEMRELEKNLVPDELIPANTRFETPEQLAAFMDRHKKLMQHVKDTHAKLDELYASQYNPYPELEQLIRRGK